MSTATRSIFKTRFVVISTICLVVTLIVIGSVLVTETGVKDYHQTLLKEESELQQFSRNLLSNGDSLACFNKEGFRVALGCLKLLVDSYYKSSDLSTMGRARLVVLGTELLKRVQLSQRKSHIFSESEDFKDIDQAFDLFEWFLEMQENEIQKGIYRFPASKAAYFQRELEIKTIPIVLETLEGVWAKILEWMEKEGSEQDSDFVLAVQSRFEELKNRYLTLKPKLISRSKEGLLFKVLKYFFA